ncbi:MAG: hypothetical protein ABIJ12_14390 [bacterium]
MKILRYVLAFVITVGLLYMARTNSRGNPEFITHTENGYTFEYTDITKASEKETIKLSLKIIGPVYENLRPVFRSLKKSQDINTDPKKYALIPMSPDDSAENMYYAQLTTGDKGSKQLYYFEIRDNVGGRPAVFYNPSGNPFVLKSIGHVPIVVLLLHIFCMFASVFLITLGAIKGIELLQDKNNTRPLVITFALAALFAFLGGYPFGFMMNNYAFGTIWEGVPFGTDATDNKTQILFVYLLFLVLVGLGSLTKGKLGKDIFSAKTLGGLGIIGFLLMLAIYLIPHSIQFEPNLTKIVCWGWIALIAIIYLAGLFTSGKKRK